MNKNQLLATLILIGIIFLNSCGNENKSQPKEPRQPDFKTEIITNSYSIKTENGSIVKDTINMIQSIVKDKNGREEANIFYNLDGSISWKDEYKYDESGNKIGSNYFEGGSKQTSYYIYSLDSLGRKTGFRALDINNDTLLYDGVSKYENNGQLRKDGYINKKGEFRWNLEYEFDKTGKELGYVYIDLRSGERYPSIYNYIKMNNDGEWIERQIIENEKIQSIEIRAFKKITQ